MPKINHVNITIEYKLTNCFKWHCVEFLPNEYFDLEPNEKVAWDCVPIYSNSLDYLDIDKTLVQYIKSTIKDFEANITVIFLETFWNQGNNTIIETTISGSTSWWETIITIKLKNYPPTWEILRYTKENNLPEISHVGLIIDNDDGSQKEQIIYQN